KPVSVPNPLCMEIDFYRTDMADAAELVPGVKRLGSRTVSFTGHPEEVFRVQELVLYRLKYEM
ncbi:MAG TPA: peptide transporter, partial [Firmicutes bacterium]|nr:peptide transporter [Bacillota bacterium]